MKEVEPKVGPGLLQSLNLILVHVRGNDLESAWILRYFLDDLLGQMRRQIIRGGKIRTTGRGKGANGDHEKRRGQRVAQVREGMFKMEAVDLVGHLGRLGSLTQLQTHSRQRQVDPYVPNVYCERSTLTDVQ